MAISIHALHEESDARARAEPLLTAIFQSTLSMRRATRSRRQFDRWIVISIHALHEESDPSVCDMLFPLSEISIHALHEESDSSITYADFMSRISIHALHEESD